MALVVFLRGVNVGGYRTFRPATLVRELRELDVINIGAAGTFVIRSKATQASVRAAFARKLPFQTEIAICDGRDILKLVSQSPFAREKVRPDVIRFVSILSRPARSALSLPASLPGSGRWLLKIHSRQQRFVLGVYRREMKAIGYLGMLDRLFGAPATTRNWNTILAIASVLGARPDGRTDSSAARERRSPAAS